MNVLFRRLLVLFPLGLGPLVIGLVSPPHVQAQNAEPLSVELRQSLADELKKLEAALDALRDRPEQERADAAIFGKGVRWGLRYDSMFTPADVALLQKGIGRGVARAKQLADGERSWSARTGKMALGYVSRVDQSVQPYGLIVPAAYDRAQPIRLDVVLHGSTRPVGMSELRFISRFDEGDGPDVPRTDANVSAAEFIELHPLGRVENCYRWAGETDVFEAIEDVCRRYPIDRERIVLRGMSMGASGTWHLGLKHPDRFVALGPYCGYVDTHRFSETPLPNFVKVGQLPEHQELALHMLDSIDYAANAGVVPAIACMGEKDVFFQAHVLMEEAMRREGLPMVNLISPGTGHVIDPVTHAEQMRQIGAHVARGLDHAPRELRFVTWTLKYNRCHWIELLRLEQHYARAEIAARLRGETIEFDEPRNITRFAVHAAQLPTHPQRLKIGSMALTVPEMGRRVIDPIVVAKGDRGWQIVANGTAESPCGKRPRLQGPIDDAFVAPFVCVRGTGRPWNDRVQKYADASLVRFADEWRHYFRGELPVKEDSAITDDDLRTRNLVLFGDPGSNRWIKQALPQLPLEWKEDRLRFAGGDYPAADHLPALIVANPLPGGEGKYLVLNSGHTFREAELAKLNYLLFPRWGDWAILQVAANVGGSAATASETVLRAGYFDEDWKLPRLEGTVARER